ncbi:zinc ABC transporter substrate-binding protein AztC [Nocardia vermiculata]|uniref:Zinc ABC transporter substrate-binding protein n=1 Tax=Nocardia vermiculata TaxID=257274 RepID=A0A846Y098_9NOCA|nr:zinc ABC transporter substrate-binding protein AztC [Nocardia vermiculata]NKY51515.1 zinc ABC transporter substrate-binding protein [Nocardia vermiculata]
MSRTLLTLVLLLAAVAGCSSQGGHHSGKPLIVVSTNILGDVVAEIAGAEAEVKVLMPRNADPHSFEISASDAAEIGRADLFVANGLGLEEGISKTADTAHAAGVPLLEVGEQVQPIRYGSGRTAGSPDPHFWTDPDRIEQAAGLIGAAITEHAAVNAPVVHANTVRYQQQVRGLTSFMEAQFATIAPEARKLVTNHHVFGYLAQRFGFTVIGAVVPSGTTLASPSASDLAGLAATIREARVPAIFVDSSQPDRLARVLAEEAKLTVKVTALHTESLGEEGTEAGTYLDMMRSNAEKIAAGLRG